MDRDAPLFRTYHLQWNGGITLMNLTIFNLVILLLMAFICLYALVDRIAKCFENCAIAKAYGQYGKKEELSWDELKKEE